jgi:hypothetical protein
VFIIVLLKLLRRILKVLRVVPLRVRVLSSPLDLVLKLVIVDARSSNLIDSPLLLTVYNLTLRIQSSLAGQRIIIISAEIVSVKLIGYSLRRGHLKLEGVLLHLRLDPVVVTRKDEV